MLGGQLVHQLEPACAALGSVDDRRHHGHVATQRQQPVTVRGVVTVEAPDPAQRGRPGRALRRSLRISSTWSGWRPCLACSLAYQRQLLPDAEAARITRRELLRGGQPPAVALAHAHALERQQRVLEQLRRARRPRLAMRSPSPTEIDHQRHVGVAREEARPRAARPERCRPRRAAPWRRPRRSGAADRRRRGTPAARRRAPGGRGRRSASSPRRRGRAPRRRRSRAGRARASPGRAPVSSVTLGQHALDPLARVHRHRHHGQVLRQAQQALGLQPLLGAEPLGAAQQHAGLEARGGRRGRAARRRGTASPARSRSPK